MNPLITVLIRILFHDRLFFPIIFSYKSAGYTITKSLNHFHYWYLFDNLTLTSIKDYCFNFRYTFSIQQIYLSLRYITMLYLMVRSQQWLSVSWHLVLQKVWEVTMQKCEFCDTILLNGRTHEFIKSYEDARLFFPVLRSFAALKELCTIKVQRWRRLSASKQFVFLLRWYLSRTKNQASSFCKSGTSLKLCSRRVLEAIVGWSCAFVTSWVVAEIS